MQVAVGESHRRASPDTPFTVDDAVSDQTHGAGATVGAADSTPGARHRVGAAALAGAEAGRLAPVAARVEDDVLALRLRAGQLGRQ